MTRDELLIEKARLEEFKERRDIIAHRLQIFFMYGGITVLSYFAHFSWGTVGLWAPIVLTIPVVIYCGLEVKWFLENRALERSEHGKG